MSSFLEGSGPVVEQAWAWFVVAGTLVLLVAAWRVLGKLAERHKAVDRRAGTKRLAALAFAVLLGAGGWLAVTDFEAKSDAGIHSTFVKNLDLSVGESVYQEATKTVATKPDTIATQAANLATLTATAANDPSEANIKARNELWSALNQSRKDLAAAQVTVLRLGPNHALWLQVKPLLDAHHDEEARVLLEKSLDAATVGEVVDPALACARDPLTGFCTLPATVAPLSHTHKDSHLADVTMADGIEEAYHNLAAYREQMASQMRWLVYPNLTGLMLAPFAFAGGSILRRAFVPSDTVGYKPYPGKAAGFFLLLGGGAFLAIPFSAWLLRDFAKRSKEGQISL